MFNGSDLSRVVTAVHEQLAMNVIIRVLLREPCLVLGCEPKTPYLLAFLITILFVEDLK